jgi:hypothetical protein
LSKWEDGFLPTLAVVHALSVPGLRPVAVETLDKMGPVTGQKESRLLAELASLKPGTSKQFRVSGMPGLYGRDPRVLNYLQGQVRNGNRWERALAASVLCGLGDVETSLTAAVDPESRVRRSLAAAIGTFREARGVEVLQRFLADSNFRVARQAAESLNRLGIPSNAPVEPAGAGGFEWQPFLKELSEFRLTDSLVTARMTEERIQSGWLGEPGATETQVQALEHRIGRQLPLSYRAFLAASNGFHQQSSFISKMFAAEDVDWFQARNADWAKAYRETYPNLGSTLQVSAVGDAAVVLLNPAVVTEDGEWETYFFSNWNPGARPHPSFRAFMEAELETMCQWKGH